MIINKFLGSILVLVSMLSGCSIQSTQMKAVADLIKNQGLDFNEYKWLLTYGDYQSVVYAVSTPKVVLFSNRLGDEVLFDGWNISKVRGLGNSQFQINISDTDGVRYFAKGNRVFSGHNCSPWNSEYNEKVVKYSQVCKGDRSISGRNYENTILVSEDGSISKIRQIVDERYTALTLTKLK